VVDRSARVDAVAADTVATVPARRLDRLRQADQHDTVTNEKEGAADA